MNTRAALWWAAMALVLWGAWRQYGGLGLLLAFSMLMFWLTIQFSQTMRVLKRAAGQPKGTVAHALKLHIKLKPGMKLLSVIGLTGSLGEMLSEPDTQPEVFRWTDDGDSHVTCEFRNGRLARWELVRPPEQPESSPDRSSGGASGGAP
ncbi:MAG: glycerate kinase [Hydrogenophaga sp.]|nr:glycerate kinase [Hydrogenophaga sp.]